MDNENTKDVARTRKPRKGRKPCFWKCFKKAVTDIWNLRRSFGNFLKRVKKILAQTFSPWFRNSEETITKRRIPKKQSVNNKMITGQKCHIENKQASSTCHSQIFHMKEVPINTKCNIDTAHHISDSAQSSDDSFKASTNVIRRRNIESKKISAKRTSRISLSVNDCTTNTDIDINKKDLSENLRKTYNGADANIVSKKTADNIKDYLHENMKDENKLDCLPTNILDQTDRNTNGNLLYSACDYIAFYAA
ncbi:unnamed protein product [Thelazia callipaeda]|uniref:ULP_PROTEASE domain-containing protein n=1 Tax=Thelazia callipaeda TaxID=103827 RepID=A0A0N5CXR1_THECL|nr:unnamed protein product [Thelazia callipaeda]